MRLENQKELIALLSNTVDPFTNKTRTDSSVAEDFKLHPETVGKYRRSLGYYRFPPIGVSNEQPAENVRAFLLGMVIGPRFSVDIVHRGRLDYPYVAVSTETVQQRLINLLDVTLKPKGQEATDKVVHRIYLSYEVYKYLANPLAELTGVLSSKYRFSPFLLAVLGVNLSEKRFRLTLNGRHTADTLKIRSGVLERIHSRFESFFGFRMGYLGRRKDQGTAFIEIHHPDRVYGALLEQSGVRSLPFFDYLPSLHLKEITNPDNYARNWEEPRRNIFLEEELPELAASYVNLKRSRQKLFNDS